MGATYQAYTGTSTKPQHPQFNLQFDSGTTSVTLLSLYANETHQYNMALGADVTFPAAEGAEWLQRMRAGYLRRMPVDKLPSLKDRKRAALYGSFIKGVYLTEVKGKTVKKAAVVGVTIPDPALGLDPDFVYVTLSAPAGSLVTVTVMGGNIYATNEPPPVPKPKKTALPVRWDTDKSWKGVKGARTPVALAGNELEIVDLPYLMLGPAPYPKAGAQSFGIYKSRTHRYNDAYGKVTVRNTGAAPLTTNLLYGDLRIWKPDPTDPTGARTVSELQLDGGAAGVIVDRRIQLAPTLVATKPPSKGARAGFVYMLAGSDYCSEGLVPDMVGGIYNGPGDRYESQYIYGAEGDVRRTTTPMKLTGASAKDTLRVTARAAKNLPVDVTNATLEVWLDSPAESDKTRVPTLDAALGNLSLTGGVVRLTLPATGLLDYAAWVRLYRGDRLVNWRNWVADPYEAPATVTKAPASTAYVNPKATKTTVRFPAQYDGRSAFKYTPFATTEDPWEGNRLSGTGTLEVSAEDATFLVVTGRDTGAAPVKYYYDIGDPMVTAVYLCQTGTTAGYNYSNIKDFTGTLKVSRGHAVCTPTVLVGADDTSPAAVELINTQKANAVFQASRVELDGAGGARATIAVCGDVTMPEVVCTGTGARPARLAFQTAYVPTASGVDVYDFHHNRYPTRVTPHSSLASFSAEIAFGDYTTLTLPSTTEAGYFGTSATAGALQLGHRSRLLLGTAGFYDFKRPVKLRPAPGSTGATHELRLSDDCTVRAQVSAHSGAPVLELRPDGHTLKLLGSVGASLRVNTGTVFLVGNPAITGTVEFSPLAGATQRDRVLRTKTKTLERGRQTYGGKLVLGPNGVLRIGGD